jgi:hypothetical protein
MSVEDALRLRAERGWSSAVPPLRPGEHRFLWVSEGMVEIMFTPEDAARYEADGIVLDGRTLPARRVDEFTYINGVLLRVET